jgi:hypothetical protein
MLGGKHKKISYLHCCNVSNPRPSDFSYIPVESRAKWTSKKRYGERLYTDVVFKMSTEHSTLVLQLELKSDGIKLIHTT